MIAGRLQVIGRDDGCVIIALDEVAGEPWGDSVILTPGETAELVHKLAPLIGKALPRHVADGWRQSVVEIEGHAQSLRDLFVALGGAR